MKVLPTCVLYQHVCILYRRDMQTCHSSYDRNNNVSFYKRKLNLGNLLVQIKTSLFLYKRIQIVNFFIEKKSIVVSPYIIIPCAIWEWIKAKEIVFNVSGLHCLTCDIRRVPKRDITWCLNVMPTSPNQLFSFLIICECAVPQGVYVNTDYSFFLC